MEDQSRLRRNVALLDFTHKDHMVAFRVAAAVMAFEPGGHTLEDRQAGAREREFHALEAVNPRRANCSARWDWLAESTLIT